MRRSDELAPLSRHHHVALVRGMALRRADAAAAPDAARDFLAFLDGAGEDHFAAEEDTLGPHLLEQERARLADEHRGLREHARALRDAGPAVTPDAAHAAGALLDAHVRWEERELFPALEERLSPGELAAVGAALAAHHGDAA
jgi:hypothetical protein